MKIKDPIIPSGHVLFNYSEGNQPVPGSPQELEQFEELQKGFANQFELFFPDNFAPKTIVVIPSLTLDREVLGKIKGALHYEERLLCLLMLLQPEYIVLLFSCLFQLNKLNQRFLLVWTPFINIIY